MLPGDFLLLRTLRILRMLKITRYSPALATFEIVLVNERRSLLAAGTILAVALLLAAGALHHLEGEVQPEAFGSIPAAMWWAIVTLTTVGYGDVVPITPAGRIVGGLYGGDRARHVRAADGDPGCRASPTSCRSATSPPPPPWSPACPCSGICRRRSSPSSPPCCGRACCRRATR